MTHSIGRTRPAAGCYRHECSSAPSLQTPYGLSGVRAPAVGRPDGPQARRDHGSLTARTVAAQTGGRGDVLLIKASLAPAATRHQLLSRRQADQILVHHIGTDALSNTAYSQNGDELKCKITSLSRN